MAKNNKKIESILSLIDAVHKDNIDCGKLKSINCNSLSTDKCKMLRLYMCDNPSSLRFGHMYGFFVYNDEIYEFDWNIHEPNQKVASLSNRMLSLEKIEVKTEYGIEYLSHVPPKTGYKAFWLYTPDRMLDGFDYDLRQLMRSIKAYAVNEKLCKHIRKFDKQHIRWFRNYPNL